MNEENKKIIYAVIFKNSVLKQEKRVLRRSSAKKYNIFGFTDSINKIPDLIRKYYARQDEVEREFREYFPSVSSEYPNPTLEISDFYDNNKIRVKRTANSRITNSILDIIIDVEYIEIELDDPLFFDYWKCININRQLGFNKYINKTMTYEA